MKILVQNKFTNLLESSGFTFFDESTLRSDEIPEIAIGDVQFLGKLDCKNQVLSRILIGNNKIVSAGDLSSVQPSHIIAQQAKTELTSYLQMILSQMTEQKNTQALSKEIQKKRKELEVLNEKLISESEAQYVSLQKSTDEEMQKNLNEKSLLYFLDFISSESLNDDFVSQILKLIWKELKKMGYAYQIGFCFENLNKSVAIITYNGIIEKNDVLKLDISRHFNSGLLATALGRPVGKILSWKLTEFSRAGYFFVETIDQQFAAQAVELYFKERMFTLSLYFDRWQIEKEYQALIERWDQTFQSFSGYTHVIDENYMIHQANYLDKTKLETGLRCHEVLAQSSSPCELCPIKLNGQSDFYLTQNTKVRASSSEFWHEDKKFYFLFYEDMTNLDLLKSKMIQSEKMATLGRLGNHLSHELNNPLTGLKLYTQLLLSSDGDGLLTPSLKSDFNEILKATERCEKIIKNLLQFSQQEEGVLAPVSFNEVLESTLTLLKTALRPHRMFIDLKKDMIAADPTALQQVLFNILKNACQAMDKPGSIKIFQVDQADTVTFCIQDSGSGLSTAIQKNIFSPFTTTKKVGEGTGLGLYLSKKLMTRMNADLLINYDYKNGFEVDLVFKKI
ncbi:MAG: HAMP domain-containing histidine kinase [Bdellovibrio sp.]|nr:HAMP domain-containing histidine kinase [Bdellovibrio sp.]